MLHSLAGSSQLWPVKLARHAHSKPLILSVQEPPFKQGWDSHSSAHEQGQTTVAVYNWSCKEVQWNPNQKYSESPIRSTVKTQSEVHQNPNHKYSETPITRTVKPHSKDHPSFSPSMITTVRQKHQLLSQMLLSSFGLPGPPTTSLHLPLDCQVPLQLPSIFLWTARSPYSFPPSSLGLPGSPTASLHLPLDFQVPLQLPSIFPWTSRSPYSFPPSSLGLPDPPTASLHLPLDCQIPLQLPFIIHIPLDCQVPLQLPSIFLWTSRFSYCFPSCQLGSNPCTRPYSAGCPGAGDAGGDAHWLLEQCCNKEGNVF